MDGAGIELPVLIGQTGPLNGQRWQVEQPLIVGRDATCDIVISDRQISRYHARFTPTEDGILLEDLGSKNGTFRNGERMESPAILMDGDLIQISLVQHFVFLSSDATIPLDATLLPARPALTKHLTLDIRSRRVWVGGKEILPPLSVPQFRLLQALYDQEGKVVERQNLINIIWGEREAVGVSEQAFDALVRRLRDRLGENDPGHVYITTIRGHGLRLDNPEK